MVIYVASPYSGKQENIDKAREYVRDVLDAGHVPIAPHVMYHDTLDDNNLRERVTGIKAGIELLHICDEMWVYGDYRKSAGCLAEIEECQKRNIPYCIKGATKEQHT